MSEKIATIENVRAVADKPGVFAYDPATGDEFSADPRDYFWMAEGDPLVNWEGEPLILVTRSTSVVPA